MVDITNEAGLQVENQNAPGRFGKPDLDVGIFGRGSRLLWGLAFLLPLAMSVYIGLSFILQWKMRYGGCEVVALSIILSRRRYTTYCIPLIALDAVEKVVIERVLPPSDSSNSPA